MTIEEQMLEREEQQANNQYQGVDTIGRSAFTTLIANPLIDSAVINSSSKGNINTFLGAMDSGIYRNNTILGGNFIFGDETIFDKGKFGKKFKAFRDSIGTKIGEFGGFTVQRVGADAQQSAGLMTDAFKASKVQADHVLESGFGFSRNYTSFFKRMAKYKNEAGVVQNEYNGQTMTRKQMIEMASDKTTRTNALYEMKNIGGYADEELSRISKLSPEGFSAEMNKFATRSVENGNINTGNNSKNIYDFYNKTAGFGNEELANVDNVAKTKHFQKFFSNMSAEELSGFQEDLAKTGVKTKAVMSSSDEEALTAMRKAFNSGSKDDAIAAMKYLNASEISESVLLNFDSKNINKDNIDAVKGFLTENGFIKKNASKNEVRKYVEKVAKYAGKNKASNKEYVRLARVIQNGSEEITDGQAHAMVNSKAFRKKMSKLASKATKKEAAEELGEKVVGKFMEKTIFEEVMSNKAVQIMTGNVATGMLGFGLNVAGAVVGTMASLHSEAAINNFSDVMTYKAIKGEDVTNHSSAMSTYGHSNLSYSNDQDLYNILSSDNMADRYRKDIDQIDIDDRGGKLSDFLVY